MSVPTHPNWDMYKDVVNQRKKLPKILFIGYTVGQIIIRIVEEGCMEDWADTLICQAMVESDEPGEIAPWWEIFEDDIGSYDAFDQAAMSMYSNYNL